MMPEHLKRMMDEMAALMQRDIPPITGTQLEGFLNEAQAVAKENLLAKRSLDPFARIIFPALADITPSALYGGATTILPGGQLAVLHLPLPLPDDPVAKAHMFSRLRIVCQVLAAMAVILVTDAWTLWNDDKTGSPATTIAGSNFAREHGMVAASKAGHGTLTEIIMANAQTRDQMMMRSIPYERRFRGGVLSPNGQNPLGVPHTISVLEEKAFVVRCPQDHNPARSNTILIYRGPLDED